MSRGLFITGTGTGVGKTYEMLRTARAKIKEGAERVIAHYQPLMDAVIAKYRPRLEGKTVMLFVAPSGVGKAADSAAVGRHSLNQCATALCLIVSFVERTPERSRRTAPD